MNEQERTRVLDAVRQAVLDQNYVMTRHAVLEMRNDRLDVVDVESAILTGTIDQVFEDVSRGRRYEIVGKACDLSTTVGVVVRFAGPVLIITVYEKNP
jgi:hypothetical protein